MTNNYYSYNALGQLTAITNGNTNYASEGTYDSLGRLVSLTAGNGKITSRTWDEEKPGTLSGYDWDPNDEYVPRTLKWDNLGNIKSISKGTETKPYTNKYEYDSLNRLIKEKNGADTDITTKKLDKLNFKYVKNDIICDKNGEYVSDAVHFDYNAGSAIVDLGSTRQLSSLKVFGKNNRISPEYLEIWLSKDGKEWNQDTDVTWETDLNGLKASFPNGTEARYVKLHSLWDERDQEYAPVDKSTFHGNLWNLFEVSFTANGKENSYTYDARGNCLIENEKYGGNSNLTSTEYFYYANSDLIKKAGTWYFNYDKNGNLIAKGTSATEKTSVSDTDTFAVWTFSQTQGELWTYDYDLQNRMVKASYSDKGTTNLNECASYVYDYRGLLVKKTYQDYVPSNYVQVEGNHASKSITEYYEYTSDGRVIYNETNEGDNTKETTYIWANQTLWCQTTNNVIYYHHTDHLGTTEVITDCNGTVVWEAGYEAFGSVLSERGDSSFTPSYTGKFFDKSSGLYYFNARWYDSELGRFTTQDPARDGVNWYAYCNNSSLIFVDPDGRDIVQLLDYDRGRAAQPLLNKIPFGHSAALVGNDSDGWLYYSNDGSSSTDVQWFSSKQDFFDNYAKDRATPFNYQEGSSVKTSVEQDKAMQTKAFELAGINTDIGFAAKETGERFVISEKEKPSPYSFLTNNCSQHVGEIALSGDVFTTEDLIPKFQILMDKDTFLLYEASKCMNMSN